MKRTSADTTRAREDLGWQPTVGLREGLHSQLEWVRARRRALNRTGRFPRPSAADAAREQATA